MFWKAFLAEIDHEIQQYQLYRAHQKHAKVAGAEIVSQRTPLGQVRNSGPRGDETKLSILVARDTKEVNIMMEPYRQYSLWTIVPLCARSSK